MKTIQPFPLQPGVAGVNQRHIDGMRECYGFDIGYSSLRFRWDVLIDGEHKVFSLSPKNYPCDSIDDPRIENYRAMAKAAFLDA